MIVFAILFTGIAIVVTLAVIFANGMGAVAAAFVGRPLIWLAWIVAAIFWLAWAVDRPARAHDHSRPHLNDWYKGLTSGKGPCCDGTDHSYLSDVDWESKGGRYRVRIEGQWHDVPPEAVLDGPNLDGRTLVWPIKGWGGLTIRCFIPGSMT